MNLSSLSASFLPLKAKHQWYLFLKPRDVLFGHWLFAPRCTRMICWLEFIRSDIWPPMFYSWPSSRPYQGPCPSKSLGGVKVTEGISSDIQRWFFYLILNLHLICSSPRNKKVGTSPPSPTRSPNAPRSRRLICSSCEPRPPLGCSRWWFKYAPNFVAAFAMVVIVLYFFLPLPWFYRFTQKTLVGHLSIFPAVLQRLSHFFLAKGMRRRV